MSYDPWEDEIGELLAEHGLLHAERAEGTPIEDGISYSHGRFGWRILLQITVGDRIHRLVLHKPHGAEKHVVDRESWRRT